MTTKIDYRSLEYTFNPRSIAVYGASADLEKIGGRALRSLATMDFEGPVYPINPARKTIQGQTAYPSAEAVPGDIDLAILVVPVTAVSAALRDCARKGVRSVLIMSSGFSEIGGEGEERQAELLEIANANGIRVLGPNCVGFVNSSAKVSATFTPTRELCWPPAGSIGIASQSGAFASLCAATMSGLGVGLGTWITTGNEADVDLADAIAFLAQDSSVNVIAAYMEGCRDAQKLSEALEAARAAGKPVVMLKVGTTDVGADAAASHTGALAGRDDLFDAFLKHHGVLRVKTVEALLDTAYACSLAPRPASRRTLIVSTSGGVGVLMGDTAIGAGLTVDPLPEEARAAIRDILPFAGTRNPVDPTAQIISEIGTFRPCFEVSVAGAQADIVITHLAFLGYDDAIMSKITQPLIALRRAHPDCLFILSILCSVERKKEFEEAGFLVFSDPSRAVLAAAQVCTAAEMLTHAPPQIAAGHIDVAVSDVQTELEAKALISGAGIPVTREQLVRSADEAGQAALEINGKVVLKVVSRNITHKSEVGGVLLDIEGSDAAGNGYRTIIDRVTNARPDAEITGVLVSQQIEEGIETIAGIVNDPLLGPFVMVGLGGIYAEVLKDVSFRPAPFDHSTALAMIDELRSVAILKGARSRAAANLEALADALVNLSHLAARTTDWVESVDINPLIVGVDGVVAVDALVITSRRGTSEQSKG